MAVDPHQVKALLPDIQNALSDHQFSCLKLSFHSLGVDKFTVETPDIQLTGLYDNFSQNTPVAPALLYQMLLHVIRPDDADKLKCTESLKNLLCSSPNLNPDNVELESRAALILKTGSILESLDPGSFDVTKKFIRDTKFPNYDLDHLSTPTKLLRLLVDSEESILNKDLLYQALTVCGKQSGYEEPCEGYIDEIKTLCGDTDISKYLNQMTMYEARDSGTRRSRRRSRSKISKPSRKLLVNGILMCGCVFLLGCLLTVIVVFVSYYFYPLTSEATHLLYAPPNGAHFNSRIDCYNSLTKGIAAELLEFHPFEARDIVTVVAYEIEKNSLQTYSVHLEEKTIASLFRRFGTNFFSGLNYYQDDVPFYTASDGTIVFQIQLRASSNIECPFKIFGFTSYKEYLKLKNGQIYSSYVESECFTGTNNLENYTRTFDLLGNEYYFFAVVYTECEFGVIASANTSQYLVTEHLSNCTLNYKDRCSFPTVDLSINSDSKCLVVSISRDNGRDFNATMQTSVQSHVRSVISGSVMVATFIVCLVGFVVVIGICICHYRQTK